MLNTTDILKHNPKTEFGASKVPRLGVLKVAGTQLLLDPKTELLELLKFTLFDLTLKQVLVIKKVVKKAHPRDRHSREYILVKTGKNFTKYKPPF